MAKKNETDEKKLEDIVKNNQVLREKFNTSIETVNNDWAAVRSKQNFPCPLYLYLDNAQSENKDRFSFSFEIPNGIPLADIISSVPEKWWIGDEEGNLRGDFYEKLIFEAYCKYDGRKKKGFIVTDKQKEDLLANEKKNNEYYLSFYMKGEEPDFAKSWEKFNEACENFKPLGDLMKKAVVANMKQILLNKKNVILQGAPGTGKTYNTAELALSICDDVVPSDHKEVMTRYKELVKQGRIGFVTFHQSMDYEDFVEGIKPKTMENVVTYEIEDGIFKTMCKNAEKIENKQANSKKIDFGKKVIFKMSLGEKGRNDVEIFDFCLENNVIALGWGDDKDFSECKKFSDFKKLDPSWGANAVAVFKESMRNGDIVLIADGVKAIKAIAQIVGDYEYHNDYPIKMCQYRKVKWLYTGESIPISKLYDKSLSQQTIYAFGTRSKNGTAKNGGIKLDELNDIITGKVKDKPVQNYVLIIDEINRGNVSKIFGELISLLEADKREGCDHPLPVTLPYSKKPFSVPSNLYIIGTMNTTDRSVGSIDYAVRRRFAFVTLKADKYKVPEGNARNLFNAVKNFLNKSKYDMDIEDLMVGHSYFMDANNLQMKWQYEILPLLMEYHKDGIISKSPLKDDSGNEIADVKKDYAKFVEAWQKKESDSPNP